MTNPLPQNIIQELGLDGLPEDKQIGLLTTMTESVLKRITIKILEKLTDAERQEFEEKQKTADPKQMDEFLRSKIPDYDQMLLETVNEFKEEMKINMADLRKGLEQ